MSVGVPVANVLEAGVDLPAAARGDDARRARRRVVGPTVMRVPS